MKFTKGDYDPEDYVRLERFLLSWEGTPYRANAQLAGVGADCRSFVLAGLDFLYGTTTDIGSLPPDAALHQPEVARAFLRRMAKQWCCHNRKVKGTDIEPGDLIVTGYDNGGPTHIAIAGMFPWVWDCIPGVGVRRSGYDSGGLKYFGHWRLPNKQIWSNQKQPTS